MRAYSIHSLSVVLQTRSASILAVAGEIESVLDPLVSWCHRQRVDFGAELTTSQLLSWGFESQRVLQVELWALHH